MIGLEDRSSRAAGPPLLNRTSTQRALHFAILFLSVLLLSRDGIGVPRENELIYLPYLAKQYDQSYLKNDWAYSVPWQGAVAFEVVFGPLTRVFPLHIVGWLGRVLVWSFVLAALLALAGIFGVPLSMGTVSIVVWLLLGQSLVGQSFILGTFEASAFASGLLLFSLKYFAERKDVWASILAGLCFSFHPGVGLWALLSIGLALLSTGYTARRFGLCVACMAIAALPGILPLAPVLVGASSLSADDASFLVFVHHPYHLNAISFPKRTILALFFLLFFNWLHFRTAKNDRALRFLVWFQVWLGVLFVLGVLLSFLGIDQLVKFYPFRLFPMLIPLSFLFQLMNALRSDARDGRQLALVIVGVLAVSTLGDVPGRLADRIQATSAAVMQPDDSARLAFKWIAENTPADAVVIAPPWRKDSYYYTRRAQVANWHAPRLDRYREWRERIDALVGPVAAPPGRTYELAFEEQPQIQQMARAYGQLTEDNIREIVGRYGGDYLVSVTPYVYPVVHSSGAYRVYSLEPLHRDGPRSSGLR